MFSRSFLLCGAPINVTDAAEMVKMSFVFLLILNLMKYMFMLILLSQMLF